MSSYRSILAWKNKGSRATDVFNIKVTLDANIGSTQRVLSRSQIERASATSFALGIANKEKYLKSGIHFIDEPVSIYLKDHQFGYSFRELPQLAPGEEIMPMFSLYSTKNKEQSILQELIEKSGQGYRSYVSEHLLKPMTRHMIQMYFQDGLISEPHEQNVCVKLKDGKLTTEFYYRDLAGFHFDPKMRETAGKNMNFIPKSFNQSSLKLGRADLINNISSYLLNSNFYALRSAIKSNSISKAWVEQIVFETIQTEIKNKTNFNANNWTTLKTALTKYKNTKVLLCKNLFGS